MIYILIPSLIVNAVLFYYGIAAARKLYVVATNVQDLQDMFVEFKAHATAIYESEVFYGDESLKSFLDHSKMITNELENYEDLLALIEEEESDDQEEIY